MMAPHWLDEVFQVPEKAAGVLVAADRFKEAVAKAQAAYHEAQDFHRKNPQVVGSTPAQKARVVFLLAINAE